MNQLKGKILKRKRTKLSPEKDRLKRTKTVTFDRDALMDKEQRLAERA